MAVRCKFRCVSTTERIMSVWNGKESRQVVVQEATFNVAMDGSEENKRFFEATPCGTLTIGTAKEQFFKAGEYYYLDLEVAPS